MIRLHLQGSGEASLETVRDALLARDLDPEVVATLDAGALYVELHPAAEPIRIARTDEGRFSLYANTVTAGPGYHRHVVELAESLDVSWDGGGDDTGWRESRDDGALEEIFLDWLGAAAAQILEWVNEGGLGFALAMPAGHRYEHRGAVATQLGPRDIAWLEATRAHARAGADCFPWWGAERDARYYRGLALVAMWSSIRWRPPITDEERALMESVSTWVEKAHGLDVELELPWAEQAEILSYLEEASLRATRALIKAQSRPAPALGYRRGPVRVTLSGEWSLTIPGELAERWEGRGTWVGWDATRSVFFNSLTVRDTQGQLSPSTEATLASLPPLDGDELLELERDDLRGFAAATEEDRDGEHLHRIDAHAAVGPHAAISTMIFVEPGDREWALETWGSLSRG